MDIQKINFTTGEIREAAAAAQKSGSTESTEEIATNLLGNVKMSSGPTPEDELGFGKTETQAVAQQQKAKASFWGKIKGFFTKLVNVVAEKVADAFEWLSDRIRPGEEHSQYWKDHYGA